MAHPFTETIKEQYGKRELLFKNKFDMPKLLDLQIVKAVQSVGAIFNNLSRKYIVQQNRLSIASFVM